MKNLIKGFVVLLILISSSSCEPKFEKQYSWAYPLAGDWTLTAYVDGEYVYGPFEVMSYNPAFGQDSIWFDDYDGNFWDMKYKVAVDMNAKTFQTSGSTNAIDGYPINIIVSDGKVVNTDSITFNMEFEDDPGTIYTLSGHRTTSYEEYMQE